MVEKSAKLLLGAPATILCFSVRKSNNVHSLGQSDKLESNASLA